MKEDPTTTARLREDLKKLPPSEEFTSEDFNMYPQVSGLLFKMERRSEVIHTGWRPMGGTTKPLKVYKVGALRLPKPKEKTGQKKESSTQLDSRIEPWVAIYPEFFRLPAFKELGRITVKET